MRNQKDKDPFILSKEEKRILSVLNDKEAFSPAYLVIETGLPRTTLVRTLSKLEKRGFIEPIKKGKRGAWKRATSEGIERNVFTNMNLSGFLEINKTIPGFSLLKGTSSIVSLLEDLLIALPRNGQFNGIQPTESGLIMTRKAGVEKIIEINNLIKRKEIIVKGVLGEDFLTTLTSEFGHEWLDSFAGRLEHTSFVAKEYMQYEADLYLIGNRAMITNWKGEVGVLIENADIVKLLKSTYKFMHDMGRRINNNEIAKLLMEK